MRMDEVREKAKKLGIKTGRMRVPTGPRSLQVSNNNPLLPSFKARHPGLQKVRLNDRDRSRLPVFLVFQ